MPIDVKDWLAKQAAALGLSDSERAAAEKLLSSEKFRGDFVALPDFHSALDKQRAKYQSEYDKVLELNNQWQEEFDTRYAPALDTVQKLQAAGYNMSGFQNDGRGGVVNGNTGQTFTLEDVQKIVRDAIEPVRVGVLDYNTFVAEKAAEYSSQYGKPFPVSKFRQFAYENHDKFGSYEAAFDAFTADDRKAKEEKEREDWRNAEREKIRMEVMSGQSLPESAGNEGAPMFLANTENAAPSADEVKQAFVKTFATADFSKVNI